MKVGLGEVNSGVRQSVGSDADRPHGQIKITVLQCFQIRFCVRLLNKHVRFIKASGDLFPDLNADPHPLNGISLGHHKRRRTTDADT